MGAKALRTLEVALLAAKDGVLPHEKCLAFLGAMDSTVLRPFLLKLLVDGLEVQDKGESLASAEISRASY